jgi:hypothetical protein
MGFRGPVQARVVSGLEAPCRRQRRRVGREHSRTPTFPRASALM